MSKYYNTSDEQISTIKRLVKLSDKYNAFQIKFESPVGDVLYLKRIDTNEYEKYMSIGNLFGLGVKQL